LDLHPGKNKDAAVRPAVFRKVRRVAIDISIVLAPSD